MSNPCPTGTTKPDTIEALTFNVAGVKFRPIDVIESAKTGDPIKLVPEPTNEYDPFAIKVLGRSDDFLGYVPKRNTWILHLLRRAGVYLHTDLIVNHDLKSEEELLCRVTFAGNNQAELINT